MDTLHALILGLIQGLTEYLPVSSSGHLEIGKALLGGSAADGGLTFDIMVHVATVLSTIVVLWKEIAWIFKGLFKGKLNDETRYVINIIISMIPVGIVGLLFKEQVEALYEGHALAVTGVCLLVTAALLALTHFYKPKEKEHISPSNAFVIGIAQALAVLPGLSRSGSTIATGLLLGNSRKNLAQFSFLMVTPPILGEAILECKDIISASTGSEAAIPTMSLIVGFLAAFVSGCFACKCMIALVKKCKLIYFAAYCAIVGAVIVAYNILS